MFTTRAGVCLPSGGCKKSGSCEALDFVSKDGKVPEKYFRIGLNIVLSDTKNRSKTNCIIRYRMVEEICFNIASDFAIQ